MLLMQKLYKFKTVPTSHRGIRGLEFLDYDHRFSDTILTKEQEKEEEKNKKMELARKNMDRIQASMEIIQEEILGIRKMFPTAKSSKIWQRVFKNLHIDLKDVKFPRRSCLTEDLNSFLKVLNISGTVEAFLGLKISFNRDDFVTAYNDQEIKSCMTGIGEVVAKDYPEHYAIAHLHQDENSCFARGLLNLGVAEGQFYRTYGLSHYILEAFLLLLRLSYDSRTNVKEEWGQKIVREVELSPKNDLKFPLHTRDSHLAFSLDAQGVEIGGYFINRLQDYPALSEYLGKEFPEKSPGTYVMNNKEICELFLHFKGMNKKGWFETTALCGQAIRDFKELTHKCMVHHTNIDTLRNVEDILILKPGYVFFHLSRTNYHKRMVMVKTKVTRFESRAYKD